MQVKKTKNNESDNIDTLEIKILNDMHMNSFFLFSGPNFCCCCCCKKESEKLEMTLNINKMLIFVFTYRGTQINANRHIYKHSS